MHGHIFYTPMSGLDSNKPNLRKLRRRDYHNINRGLPENLDTMAENISEDLDFPHSASEISEKPPGELNETTECSDTDDDVSEGEITRMKDEMSKLKKEEEKLKKRTELQLMRKRLQEQREKVQNLRGTIVFDTFTEKQSKKSEKVKSKKSPVRSTKSSHMKDGSKKSNIDISLADDSSDKKSKKDSSKKASYELSLTDDIDINTLRKEKSLRDKARKELKLLELLSDTETDSSESSSSSESYFDSSDESVSDSKKKKQKHKKKKKKKKSGINAKASDRVRNPQKWPHSHLQFEYVNKQVKYDELDFKLFVAGELEIISDPELSSAERSGRLTLLKKIVYYYSTYEFKGLKAFYAAWVREIEMGKKKWSDDSAQIETAILSKYVMKTSKFRASQSSATRKPDAQGSEDKIWFCQAYQRNKCPHKATHTDTFRGKLKLAQHICATCWQKDKQKLGHPECSSSCPHTSK